MLLGILGLLFALACHDDVAVDPGQPPVDPGQPPERNHPPIAVIQAPAVLEEGRPVRFSARGSSDPDGDQLFYRWLPGAAGIFVDPSASLEANWAYPDNGTFTVSVVVRDSSGAADTASTVVTVTNLPPQIYSLVVPLQQAAGFPGMTQLTFADPGYVDSHVVTIDWGDEGRDSVIPNRDEYSVTVGHAYARPGPYWITATVRDDDGGTVRVRADSVVRVIDAGARRIVGGYEVFDLGTLGGNSARPMDFNDRGLIVGSSLTASGATHAFLWRNGVMQDLGTMGQVGSEAQRVNNAGVIAGVVWSEEDEDCGHSSRPAIWRNAAGELLDIPAIQPVRAEAINESLDVVWEACGHETNWTWRLRNGQWKPLGRLTEPWLSPHASSMNEHGQIVGTFDAQKSADSPTPLPHGFVSEADTLRDLGILSGRPCELFPNQLCGASMALGINEERQVVGFSTAVDGTFHAVLWDGGAVRDLWQIPAGYDDGSGRIVINDAGQVAGSHGGEGFFWANGIAHTLGSLGGGRTRVVDMNESGTVVGTSQTANGEQHVFVWTQTRGMVDLDSGPYGFKGGWVVGISYNGDIAGFTAPCDPGWTAWCSAPSEVRALLWRRVTP